MAGDGRGGGRRRARRDRSHRQPGRISRREFLAGTTLTGVALTLPAWLSGCGSDDGDGRATPTPDATASPSPTATPRPRPRERRTLHFDFSFAALRDLRLVAATSVSNGAAIVEHSAASRARARQLNPQLAAVPDAHLTHYVEDVDLPADALQLLQVTGVDAATGADALAALYVHVPTRAARAAANRARDAGRPATVRVAGNAGGLENLVINVRGFVTPWDTAVSLVFHGQGVMNLDLDQGASVLAMIGTLPCADSDPSCAPFLGTLAAGVAEQWPATTSGGWATLVQLVDAQGMPVVDDRGDPVYRYDLDPDIAQTACMVVEQVKLAIFDDEEFRGTNWHPTQGLTVQQSAASAGRAAGAASFAVTAAHPPGTSVHGVKFVAAKVTDPSTRTVELQFRNDYLRYLSSYVQFANEAGDLPVQDPTSDDTSRAKFLAWINSNFTVLGIPRFGDDVPLSSVQFAVPADASIAKVYFGSLGVGGDAFCPEAVDGAILTLIFNIGLPSMLLAFGVAVSAQMLQALSGQYGVGIVQILKASLPLILAQTGSDLANGIFGSANSGSAKEALIELGNAVLSAFFATGAGAAVLVQIIAQAITGTLAEFAGPLGIAFRLIAIAADVATIAESVGEVLACPALFKNQLSLTMTTTVTISHDPNDFQFPATARAYEVILTYDSASKVAHKQSGTIEPGRTDPLVVTFDDVPSGGMVTVDVYLTTDTGCIVGRSTDAGGTPGPYGPVPGTQAAIALTIKELLIPLTQSTRYLHDVKLEYQDGEHLWVATAAPTATITSLMEGENDALNGVAGITLSQRTGMAGYAYYAGGQGVPFCGQSDTGIMHVLQNIFLGEDADSGLKQVPCGFEQTFGVVYDKLGPADVSGRNFFVQPTPLGYLLQSVTLNDSTPFDLDNPLTWGVFTRSLVSLAVVPTGYVVGVDRQKHKMQILELPAAPSNPATAPQAVPFAVSKMGLGSRPGLLNAPVAVTVIDAAILILEDGNQRIQAVDVSGNPVLRFQNGTSNIIELEQGAGIVYLDIGVEGLGYIYVLSFVNDGATATDYRLDIFDPQGAFLTRTTGVAAARLAVDTFRNVYTLNYEAIAGAPRVEPSLSQWNPSTPDGCPTPPAA